jgi:hypothetical protein
VHYTPIDVAAFEVIEYEEAKKTSGVLRLGKDTVGTWERRCQATVLLAFNGTVTTLTRVTRLDK